MKYGFREATNYQVFIRITVTHLWSRFLKNSPRLRFLPQRQGFGLSATTIVVASTAFVRNFPQCQGSQQNCNSNHDLKPCLWYSKLDHCYHARRYMTMPQTFWFWTLARQINTIVVYIWLHKRFWCTWLELYSTIPTKTNTVPNLQL